MAQNLLTKFAKLKVEVDPESTPAPFVTNADAKVFSKESLANEQMYLKQFDRLYSYRYRKLLDFYQNYASDRLGEQVRDVSTLNPDVYEEVLLVGTINRKMRKFEAVVHEIQNPQYLEINYRRQHDLSNPEDLLILEDATGKIELTDLSAEDSKTLDLQNGHSNRHGGNGSDKKVDHQSVNLGKISVLNLTTGCVVMVRGCTGLDQKLHVVEVVLAETPECLFLATRTDQTIPPQLSSKATFLDQRDSDRIFLFLCGLKVTAESFEDRRYRMLELFLKKQSKLGAHSAQTLVTFGGLSGALEGIHINLYFYYNYREEFDKINANLIDSVQYCQRLFEGFLKGVLEDQQRHLLVMPALRDPTIGGLPQPPFKRKLFGGLADDKHFVTLPNPGIFNLANGKTAMVWDGVNVEDYARQTDLDFHKAAQLMLLMRLVAPTCPNTIETFPADDGDFLILEKLPKVVIVGNAPDFTVRDLKDFRGERMCTIVFVPDFSKTGKIVTYDSARDEFALLEIN
jgi:hypothetical protein